MWLLNLVEAETFRVESMIRSESSMRSVERLRQASNGRHLGFKWKVVGSYHRLLSKGGAD